MTQQDSSLEPIGSAKPLDAPSTARPDGTRESPEDHARLLAAQQEIRELREALASSRERERALANELQHRVRNMLAVIRSIFRRSLENGASHKEFAEHFSGRLDAVARYQSQVDDFGSAGIEIEDMVRDELLEGHCLDGPRCSIGGPPVRLRQKAAGLIGLAIHELTTNAIKFGALAQDGTLRVEWSLEDGPEETRLRFRWSEAGVSVTTSAPRASGFGRQLIEEALPYQLGATTTFELRPGGVECCIVLPLTDQQPDADPGSSAANEASILGSEPE